MNPTKRLYLVEFKKGICGTRIVHREYVRANDRIDACDRCRKQATRMGVARLTARPVPDDHLERVAEAKSKVAFCRKAGR